MPTGDGCGHNGSRPFSSMHGEAGGVDGLRTRGSVPICRGLIHHRTSLVLFSFSFFVLFSYRLCNGGLSCKLRLQAQRRDGAVRSVAVCQIQANVRHW